jgi:hypothetical protein
MQTYRNKRAEIRSFNTIRQHLPGETKGEKKNPLQDSQPPALLDRDIKLYVAIGIQRKYKLSYYRNTILMAARCPSVAFCLIEHIRNT